MMIKTKRLSALGAIWEVLYKEVFDNLRDRRILTTMLVATLMGPLLLVGMMWFTQNKVEEETDVVHADPISIPVVGAEYAPNLIDYLRQHNINSVAPPSDPERSIKEGEHRVILVIEEGFGERLRQSKPAPVRLVYDSSVAGLEKIAMRQLENTLHRYSQTIAAMRLQVRGVSPSVLQVIAVNRSDIASPEAKNSQILMMLPYMVVFAIMMGGMYLAIDTTAGEREKGSLEPLLAQPVDRSSLVIGKLTATAVFSAATFLLALIGFALAFKYVPIGNVTIKMEASKIAFIFFTCLPFVFLAASLEVLLAAYTKSTKEAQSYMGILQMLPTLPLMLLFFLSPQPEISNMWIPSFSQALIMIETLKGEILATPLVVLSIIASLVLGAVCTATSIWFYRRERILG